MIELTNNNGTLAKNEHSLRKYSYNAKKGCKKSKQIQESSLHSDK